MQQEYVSLKIAYLKSGVLFAMPCLFATTGPAFGYLRRLYGTNSSLDSKAEIGYQSCVSNKIIFVRLNILYSIFSNKMILKTDFISHAILVVNELLYFFFGTTQCKQKYMLLNPRILIYIQVGRT
jgi:hypothetical protein